MPMHRALLYEASPVLHAAFTFTMVEGRTAAAGPRLLLDLSGNGIGTEVAASLADKCPHDSEERSSPSPRPERSSLHF